jgi:hypothetical protein
VRRSTTPAAVVRWEIVWVTRLGPGFTFYLLVAVFATIITVTIEFTRARRQILIVMFPREELIDLVDVFTSAKHMVVPLK